MLDSPTLTRNQLLRTGLGAGAAVLLGGRAMSATPHADAAPPQALAPATALTLGAWTVGMDATPSLLDDTAARLGVRLGIASIFRGKGDVWPYPGDVTLGTGRTLLVAWSLEDWGSYAWWAAGSGDAVLRDQARRLKAYGRPVALRPWAEMNGDWTSHQVRPVGSAQAIHGGTPAEFVAAWRRVVTIFRAEGATNVRWVLNPTTDTYTGTTDARTCYPGSDYVDVLGLDGYNWGTGADLTWRTFHDVYRTQYARLVALDPGKPVWICEVSCADPTSTAGAVAVSAPFGASKGRWWRDMFARLDSHYPKVAAVVLFDAAKERDWRAASSPGALTGLRTALTRVPRTLS